MANVLKQVGEEWLINKMDESVQTRPEWIGWGTGAGTHTKTDPANALFTEASETRVSAILSKPSADILRMVGTLTANANKTITNAGVFTLVSGGTLILAGEFTGVPLLTGDKIEFTFNYEQT